MSSTRQRAQKTRQRLQQKFRKIFPKIQNTLKKAEPVKASTSPGRIDPHPTSPGLNITATIRFEAPISLNLTHQYETTKLLNVSDELITALAKRIDHCTNEMITRPDADADKALMHIDPRVKTAKYHILYQVYRDGKPIWERYFSSYQSSPITTQGQNEVMYEVDRILARFLLHHDAGFVWKVPELGDDHPHDQKSTVPEYGRPQDIHCIPVHQEAGYDVTVALRTRTEGQDRLHSFRVESSQNTPLTLQMGEEILSELSTATRAAVEEREHRFTKSHTACDGLEGSFGCRHYEEGAFELVLKVKNRFGPDFGHLSQRVHSHRQLVLPCDANEFLIELKEEVKVVRDLTDETIKTTDDLIVTAHELRSHNWKESSPFQLVIDHKMCRDRVTTQKILQRLQSGMFDALKSNGTAATITAHKRGHLVLETTICKGNDAAYWDVEPFQSVHSKKIMLLERLRKRAMQDVAAVCKDTISLDPVDGMAGVRMIVPGPSRLAALVNDAPESINGSNSYHQCSEMVNGRAYQSASPEPATNEFDRQLKKCPRTPSANSLDELFEAGGRTPPSPSMAQTDHIPCTPTKLHRAHAQIFDRTRRSLFTPREIVQRTPSQKADVEVYQSTTSHGKSTALSRSERSVKNDGIDEALTSAGKYIFPLIESDDADKTPSPCGKYIFPVVEQSSLVGGVSQASPAPCDGFPPTPPPRTTADAQGIQTQASAVDDLPPTPPLSTEAADEGSGSPSHLVEDLDEVSLSPEDDSPLIDHQLSPIREDADSVEGHSEHTIVYDPQQKDLRATELLAAMTPDNLHAADIPGFKATRCWAGEDPNDASASEEDFRANVVYIGDEAQADSSEENDYEKTPTQATYRHAEMRARDVPTTPKQLKKLNSADDLNFLLTPIAHTSTRLDKIAMNDDEEMDGQSAPQHNYSPPLASGSPDFSTTVWSSQSSRAVNRFPRRRSDQTPVEESLTQVSSNRGRRNATSPVGQHSSLHSELDIGLGMAGMHIPTSFGIFRYGQPSLLGESSR